MDVLINAKQKYEPWSQGWPTYTHFISPTATDKKGTFVFTAGCLWSVYEWPYDISGQR